MTTSDKNELLFNNGINFYTLPAWQKLGTGLYWEEYMKKAVDPRNGQNVSARRKRVCRNMELPFGQAYSTFITKIAESATGE